MNYQDLARKTYDVLESEMPSIYLYYLTMFGLNSHLSKYIDSSPFPTTNPIQRDFMYELKQRLPDLNMLQILEVSIALSKIVKDENAVGNHIEFNLP